MILSMYIAMYGIALWVLYFAEKVNMTVGMIGMITACVCMAIANFKYQRILERLHKAESELLEYYSLLGRRISEIERKMDDDGK